jgi:hypothetical protein
MRVSSYTLPPRLESRQVVVGVLRYFVRYLGASPVQLIVRFYGAAVDIAHGLAVV